MFMLEKKQKKYKRHKRIRAKISGTAKRPRFYVFRTPKHVYVQLIDDEKGKTILSVNDIKFKKSKIKEQKSKLQIKNKKEKEEIKRTGKVAVAYEIGKLIAQKALEKKIKEVIFDRGGYKYHGRIKAAAEGAREGGLEF